MIERRRPDRDEPSDDPVEEMRCALLDEYEAVLRSRPDPDPQGWASDRGISDRTLVLDLEVLKRLHGLNRSASGQGEDHRGAAEPPVERIEAGAASPWRIGRYVVLEWLDSGGQAQVFRVVHPELARELVLKLARRPIEPTGDDGVADLAGHEAMVREGRLLAQCDHPNLVRVVDLGVHEGRPFVVMEHVPGLNLEQFADQYRPDPRQAARLVAELARTVAYLHARGIVHQDIKPRNVLIDEQGRPCLIDFGLARLRHAWSDDAGDWVGGTASYMSPEQAQRWVERIGPRTDVFGLGGLLYHLLTGRPLYAGASRASVVRQAREAGYVPVRAVNPRAPRALEQICHTALAADPDRRYGTAAELEGALRRFLAPRRHLAMAGLAIGLSVTAVALIAPWAWRQAGPAVAAGPPPVAAPLRLQPLDVRPSPALPIHLNAEMQVSARLDAPAHGYLIALDPDGRVQLCHPGEGELPPRSEEIRFRDGQSYVLTGRTGLQAFVAVASRKPLPPFEAWPGKAGLRRLWRPCDAPRAWSYDGRRFDTISAVPRGELKARSQPDVPAPFREVCEYLAGLPGIEAIQAIAFPVRPKG